MRLDLLLKGIDIIEVHGTIDNVDIKAITHDSREVVPGALFFCLPGTTVDGHDFAAEAIEAGAVAIVCEKLLPVSVPQAIVGVNKARAIMAIIAARFFDYPSSRIKVIGVTGTDGKTTVTHMLASILQAHNWPTAVLGTLQGVRTTPEAPILQQALAGYLAEGKVAVSLEVSSHALVQHRVDAMRFEAAVFTNLSQDHLDFHGTMEAYFEAKATLFTSLRSKIGIVNADDVWGRKLLEREKSIVLHKFSLSDAKDLVLSPVGSKFIWEGVEISLALTGRHNVANALAAAVTAKALGIPKETIAIGLAALKGVPGRFEPIEMGQSFSVIVDYAHTPSALEQVLRAARHVSSPGGRVLVVFGCGGQRDKAKRPLMGEISSLLSDVTILTSDNPRNEDPLDIIRQIQSGVTGSAQLVVQPDRFQAITQALTAAKEGDVVIIAGKGHETGQSIADQIISFDDRKITREILKNIKGNC